MPNQIRMMTGGEALLETAAALGVRHAFGIASGKLSPIFAALSRSRDYRFIGVRHEASAAFMATAIGATSSSLALCLGETGPGGLNLMSGLGGAYANSIPVLAVTSSNPTTLVRPDRGAFSTSDNLRVFAPVTKSSVRIEHVDEIPEVVASSITCAMSGRPGPVHIDIPADILAAQHGFKQSAFSASQEAGGVIPQPMAATVKEVQRLLSAARRPLLIGGGGMVRSSAWKLFRTISEQNGIPAILSQMGLGLLPSQHALLVGQGGIIGGPAVLRALREADVILALGCRFSSWMWSDPPFGWCETSNQALIHVDLSEEVFGIVRAPDLAILADTGAFLQHLLPGFALNSIDEDWASTLVAERRDHQRTIEAMADEYLSNGQAMHPAALARAIGGWLGTSGFAVFDGGHTSFWSNDLTPCAHPRTRLHEPGMCHLGFGLPWAIAIKAAHPDEIVCCITGDGAFGFSLQELDTARREGISPITIIHNNLSWGVIDYSQSQKGWSFGTELSGTDYAAIARSFGCFGEHVVNPKQLRDALARAIASGLPAVIDARVRFEPHPQIGAFAQSTSGTGN